MHPFSRRTNRKGTRAFLYFLLALAELFRPAPFRKNRRWRTATGGVQRKRQASRHKRRQTVSPPQFLGSGTARTPFLLLHANTQQMQQPSQRRSGAGAGRQPRDEAKSASEGPVQEESEIVSTSPQPTRGGKVEGKMAGKKYGSPGGGRGFVGKKLASRAPEAPAPERRQKKSKTSGPVSETNSCAAAADEGVAGIAAPRWAATVTDKTAALGGSPLPVSALDTGAEAAAKSLSPRGGAAGPSNDDSQSEVEVFTNRAPHGPVQMLMPPAPHGGNASSSVAEEEAPEELDFSQQPHAPESSVPASAAEHKPSPTIFRPAPADDGEEEPDAWRVPSSPERAASGKKKPVAVKVNVSKASRSRGRKFAEEIAEDGEKQQEQAAEKDAKNTAEATTNAALPAVQQTGTQTSGEKAETDRTVLRVLRTTHQSPVAGVHGPSLVRPRVAAPSNAAFDPN